MMKRTLGVLVAFALLSCARPRCDDRPQNIRLAIVDLLSPVSAAWMGPAVADSAMSKLTGAERLTLIERQSVETLVRRAELKWSAESGMPEPTGMDRLTG